MENENTLVDIQGGSQNFLWDLIVQNIFFVFLVLIVIVFIGYSMIHKIKLPPKDIVINDSKKYYNDLLENTKEMIGKLWLNFKMQGNAIKVSMEDEGEDYLEKMMEKMDVLHI